MNSIVRRKAKKSLGQNFLLDKNILNKIIVACSLKPSDQVLEIGAGYGDLTQLIIEKVKHVFAIEIDNYLCAALEERLTDDSRLTIIHENVLKFDFKQYFKNKRNKIKVIGNIPYYITTPIIQQLISNRDKVDSIFLTVQKEFAQRVIAKAGEEDYGALSCFVQFYAEPRILFLIKRTSFNPAPKVGSCFLELKLRKSNLVKVNDEEFFFEVIRTAFSQRRKTLRNSLKTLVSAEKLTAFFHTFNLDPNTRPESLNLRDFANLANM